MLVSEFLDPESQLSWLKLS